MFSLMKNWVSEKVFSMVHGNNLVYNTCWEDPRIDKQVLNLGPDENVLVITSAGCNALSYALEGPKSVHAVDMNPRQNALLELKIAGIRELDFETFFQIFGRGHFPKIKPLYRDRLRDRLSESAREFWDRKITNYFARRTSFYFCGTCGHFAKGMNVYINWGGRFRMDVDQILAAQTMDQQRECWGRIRTKLWSRLIRFVVNRDTVLSLLGIPKAQRRQIETTYKGQVSKFVEECLDAVFGELPIGDNYFWRVYATGTYTKDCCPEYLVRENFEKLKGGLADRIHIHTGTVEGFLREFDGEISRFVLLDHMDWLSDRYYDALCAEWDAILSKAAPKTRIIWRSGGLSTDYVPNVPVTIGGETKRLGELLTLHPERAAELHRLDRVHTYGSFYVADLKGTDLKGTDQIKE